MKLLTWNINSVRLRLPLLERLIATEQPDLICLQETKTQDAFFPTEALAAQGYTHQHFTGMKSYNGVAILARQAFTNPLIHHHAGLEDCRHISVTLTNKTEVHCVYIPAGGDIPDPELNDKFAHKLRFVDELTDQFKGSKGGKIMLGDFNIAPYEHDVWSHKQLLDVVSHTPIEVEKLGHLKASRKWVDIAREFVDPAEKLYSWWSYRAQDWQTSNRGRRLDHIWATPDIAPNIGQFSILKDARGWAPQPSDHVPVIVEIE